MSGENIMNLLTFWQKELSKKTRETRVKFEIRTLEDFVKQSDMRIGRNNFINIKGNNEQIDFQKWIAFIETHKDYFIWYEDTEEGKEVLKNIDEIPEDFKSRVSYSLSKTNAYCTKKLSKNFGDCIVKYAINEVSVSLEKKITKPIAEILLEMANYLEAKIIIDDKKEFISLEQLE